MEKEKTKKTDKARENRQKEDEKELKKKKKAEEEQQKKVPENGMFITFPRTHSF